MLDRCAHKPSRGNGAVLRPSNEPIERIEVWIPGQYVVPFVPPELQVDAAICPSNLTAIYGCHHGWGIKFGSLPDHSRERWFQIPFPMVIDPEWRLELDEFALFFRSYDGCQVIQVDFWDGPDKCDCNMRIEPPLSGDFRQTDTTANHWRPRRSGGEKLPIRYALNISLKVTYDNTEDSIVFCSAHARFDKT